MISICNRLKENLNFFSVDVITLSDEEEMEGVYYYNRQNDVLRKA